MVMLDELTADLEREEAFVPHVYDDATGKPIRPGSTVKGHPTIWFGLCLEKGRIPRLPGALPREILRFVAADLWAGLTARAPWIMDQPAHVQRALGNMAYQMGVAGVLRFRNMLASLRLGDIEQAVAHALDSDWARKHVSRAKRVTDLMRGHDDP